MSFWKKLLGMQDKSEINPVKPGATDKTIDDLDYELARRKAQESREEREKKEENEPSQPNNPTY